MKNLFEIEKVIVLRRKNISTINGKCLPAYSELYRVNVIYKDNEGQRWSSTYHRIESEGIDIECSLREYHRLVRESIAEEVFDNGNTLEHLKEYIENERKYINDKYYN